MIPIVVLAAGESRRFGRNKLLADYAEGTLITKVVKTCLESRADEVKVVLGHDADAIRSELRNMKCTLIMNENYQLGQSSSVKVALESCLSYADAIMFLPADVALISSNDINVVLDAYRTLTSSIIIAAYRGKPGHPILIDKSVFPEVAMITEEGRGLKEILTNYSSSLIKVEATKEVLIDVDTVADYEKYITKKSS